MAIHNRYLSRWAHRIGNALAAAVAVAVVALAGIDLLPREGWLRTACLWLLLASPAVGVVFLFINPKRISLVRGIAGELGYDEFDPSKRPEA